MTTLGWFSVGVGVAVVLYAGFVLALLVSGRRTDARALAGFIPDCVGLFARLLKDSRVSRVRKLILVVLVLYLAMPLDLVPDFLPVVGQLDDALVVALALRWLLRGSGVQLIEEHWPGPATSKAVVLRFAGFRA